MKKHFFLQIILTIMHTSLSILGGLFLEGFIFALFLPTLQIGILVILVCWLLCAKLVFDILNRFIFSRLKKKLFSNKVNSSSITNIVLNDVDQEKKTHPITIEDGYYFSIGNTQKDDISLDNDITNAVPVQNKTPISQEESPTQDSSVKKTSSKRTRTRSSQEKAALNQKNRITRRFHQVSENSDNAIHLIENKTWKFTAPIIEHNSKSYLWKCKDKDGIKITGYVYRKSTRIRFDFTGRHIDLNSKQSEKLQSILLTTDQIEAIQKWRTSLIPEVPTKKNSEKKPSISRYIPRTYNYSYDSGKHSKCIYCGTPTAIGTMCDSCRKQYTKKRRSFYG